ncbi:MAG: TraR/DksA family transcriptional regulator [Elusimicrobia bacterium]|nr:TraR/DksA family transcriptional regulator [Elusimicrobiota bacterium]
MAKKAAKKKVKKTAARAAKPRPKSRAKPRRRPKAAPRKSAGASSAAKALAWLTPAKLKEIRANLVRMRDDILRTVRKQQVEEGVDNGDSVDQASQSIEKELLFELSDNERVTLDMIDAAIRRVDRGVFGLCEATQKPISRARLEAIPYARYSIEYQNQLEQKVTAEPESGPDFSAIGEIEHAAES